MVKDWEGKLGEGRRERERELHQWIDKNISALNVQLVVKCFILITAYNNRSTKIAEISTCFETNGILKE